VVTGEWSTLHNEELSDLALLTQCCSDGQIEKNKMGRTCITYGKRKSVNRVLVGKHEENRPLGRPRRRWKDDIQMDLSGSVMWEHGLD
jgi:hypothetical protein